MNPFVKAWQEFLIAPYWQQVVTEILALWILRATFAPTVNVTVKCDHCKRERP
jgi:hypothetical protein